MTEYGKTARAAGEYDASNLRLYARLFEEHKWQDPVIHWGVFHQTLNEIADRIERRHSRPTAEAKPEAPPSEERVDPLEVVLQLQAELASANERAERAERQLSIALSNNRQRNLALDALHYVWCTGGCKGGIHRFGEHPPLAQELVEMAVGLTRRLVTRFQNEQHRALPHSEIKTNWEEQEKVKRERDAARQDLASAVEVLRDFTPGLGKLGPWDRWERARALIVRFDAQGGGK